jgi:DNA-directed RNA polymerase subunit RPC12/RpoP
MSGKAGRVMACGKCGAPLTEGVGERHGVKVRQYTCTKCGNELVDHKDAVRAEKKKLGIE